MKRKMKMGGGMVLALVLVPLAVLLGVVAYTMRSTSSGSSSNTTSSGSSSNTGTTTTSDPNTGNRVWEWVTAGDDGKNALDNLKAIWEGSKK